MIKILTFKPSNIMTHNDHHLTISEEKKHLRKQYIQQRLQLSSSQWQLKSNNICRQLENSSIFRQSKVILSYFTFKQEPDLSLLHQKQEKKWGFPRCQGKNLVWHQWQWGEKLQIGAYDITEPMANSLLIDVTTVDLILVPGVACDTLGYRLGYGGGYYDRMLELSLFDNIPTIAIIFNDAYVSLLPRESWDKPLNYIATDLKFFKV